MDRSIVRAALLAVACASSLFAAGTDSWATPATVNEPDARHARIVEHWTAARRAAAIPRDLVRDERGQGYIRTASGLLEPYGRRIADSGGAMQPNAKPSTGDTTPPSISGMDPASGATISTTSYTFKATVTDASGLRSVSFRVQKSGGIAQSFAASLSTNNVWTVTLSGLTDGSWTWQVVAKDKASNTKNSDVVSFQVATGGGSGGSDGIVTNAPWTQGGAVQTAVGRIYFEMPSNARRTRWTGYVCSGTVVDDGVSGRSVILTASHCVYDDSNKAFARNVLFIPDQDGTTGAGTDLNCTNDPYGCWTPAYGVVDVNWTTRTFPDNVHWDYAFYVVPDSNAHSGTGNYSALDAAVANLPLSFAQPAYDLAGSSADYTYALGYSYSDDPNFMYCAEDMSVESVDDWWLGSCGLSGGSSGGPWVQGMTLPDGTGAIVSVNSWGYTNQPGMAGPKLWETSADCVFSTATTGTFLAPAADGDEGTKVTCP